MPDGSDLRSLAQPARSAAAQLAAPLAARGLYGAELADHVGLDHAPSLVSKAMRRSEIAVTECICATPNHGMTRPMPHSDGWLAVINFSRTDKELWVDGKPVPSMPLPAGTLVFHDLRRGPRANFRSPFHTLNFYLPRAALTEVAENANARPVGELDFTAGTGYADEAARGLSLALLPAFNRPAEANRLFVDSVTLAFTIHIAQVYGGMRPESRAATGSLAPWQERRAKDIMSANLQGDLPITTLAAACRLSVSHFTRCFRQTTGVAPHQWLLQRRVEAAKDMLIKPYLPLSEIALACGFADQSHFTRVFTRLAGLSPGAWRREFTDAMRAEPIQIKARHAVSRAA